VVEVVDVVREIAAVAAAGEEPVRLRAGAMLVSAMPREKCSIAILAVVLIQERVGVIPGEIVPAEPRLGAAMAQPATRVPHIEAAMIVADLMARRKGTLLSARIPGPLMADAVSIQPGAAERTAALNRTGMPLTAEEAPRVQSTTLLVHPAGRDSLGGPAVAASTEGSPVEVAVVEAPTTEVGRASGMSPELAPGHSSAVKSAVVPPADTATAEATVVTATGETATHVAPSHVAAATVPSPAVTAAPVPSTSTVPPLNQAGVRQAQKDGCSQRRCNGKNAIVHTPSPSEMKSCAAHRRIFIYKYTET